MKTDTMGIHLVSWFECKSSRITNKYYLRLMVKTAGVHGIGRNTFTMVWMTLQYCVLPALCSWNSQTQNEPKSKDIVKSPSNMSLKIIKSEIPGRSEWLLQDGREWGNSVKKRYEAPEEKKIAADMVAITVGSLFEMNNVSSCLERKWMKNKNKLTEVFWIF